MIVFRINEIGDLNVRVESTRICCGSGGGVCVLCGVSGRCFGRDSEGAGGCGRCERVYERRRLRRALAEPGIFSDLQQGETLRHEQHLYTQGESGVDRFGESWAAQMRAAWLAGQPRWP